MRLLLLCSLAIACSAPHPPPKPRTERVADAPLVPTLASHGEAPAPSSGGAHFGVKWRAAIGMLDTSDDWATTFPGVTADSIVVSRQDTIRTFDRATGAPRQSVEVAHDAMWVSRAAIVITTKTEEVGLDPTTLAPTWRAPRPAGLFLVDAWLIEMPELRSHRLRLRRATDGQVMSELDGELEHFWYGGPFVSGDRIVLQLEHDELVVADIATGNVRWRGTGIAMSVSGGRIAVAHSRDLHPFEIVDLDGHELWRVDATNIVLHDDTAYTTIGDELTAIDLLTNRVVWRRTDAGTQPFAADGDWVYRWPSSPTSSIDVLDRRTGEVAGHIPVTYAAGFMAPKLDGGPVVWLGHYLFTYGPLASPEPTTSVDARACFVVDGCPPNSVPLVGATVTLGTATATTDQHGCVRVRTDVGRAPVRIASTGGTEAGAPAQFDTTFPEAVVLDGSPMTLFAKYIGGGCHDSRRGVFP